MAELAADARVTQRPNLDQGMNVGGLTVLRRAARGRSHLHRLLSLPRHFRLRFAGPETFLPFLLSPWRC